MSQLECACGDVMMATCSTGADTAAYLALAIIAISVAVVHIAVACDCDMPSSAPRPPGEALLTPSRIYAFRRMRCARLCWGQRERTHLA